MGKEPTWRDYQEARPAELKRVYKFNDQQLEKSYRKHLHGASTTEYRKNYEMLYGRNKER